MGIIEELTNKELEQMIYEAITEQDSTTYKKLLKERKKRSLDE